MTGTITSFAPIPTPKRRWLIRILAILLGGFFIYAGAQKAADPGIFVMNIRSFHLLPDPYNAWFALTLPWLEILSGLAVITGALRRGGLLLLNGMLLVFIAVLAVAAWQGLDIECGCLGTGDGKTDIAEAIIRNILLLAVGGWLWLATEPPSPTRRTPPLTPTSASV